MARTFKPITGNITKLNEPHFAAERGIWVMIVKENDRWLAINSRDESKIRGYHQHLETQRTAKTLNLNVQATTLEGSFVHGVTEPAKTPQLAALLLPYPPAGNHASNPAVTVAHEASAAVFTVTHAGGTDQVRCNLGDPLAPAIQVTRRQAGREEIVFPGLS